MPKWTHSHGNPETALALPCGPSTPGSRVQAQDLPGRARSRALRTSLIQFPRLFHTRAGKRKFVVRSPVGVRLLHSRQAVKEAPKRGLGRGQSLLCRRYTHISHSRILLETTEVVGEGARGPRAPRASPTSESSCTVPGRCEGT